CLPVGERNIEPNEVGIVPEPAIDQVEQRVASITGRGRQSNALQITHLFLLQTVPCRRIEQVDLVEGLDQPFLDRLTEAEIYENVQDVLALSLAVRVMDIADMNDDVGFRDLFKSS